MIIFQVRKSARLLKQNLSRQDNCLSPKSTQCINADPDASFSQAEILPLEGKPYFSLIIGRSQLDKPYCVIVPDSIHNFLPESPSVVVLCYQNQEWAVNFNVYANNRKAFVGGWRQFSVDNNLRIGDACVFELIDAKELRMRVQILNGQVPARSHVGNADIPIIID
ncbi:B3 domain-containing protein [Apostasia shenzhenica]|uniref:B3 domain-containing protein n=1 Tax=Apostasia shenzhenica TaxID=1088818 RepID=A0A2I0AJS3_9ASPA|nr:B3 domain-containing protein [Apostasia shenzhenica]